MKKCVLATFVIIGNASFWRCIFEAEKFWRRSCSADTFYRFAVLALTSFDADVLCRHIMMHDVLVQFELFLRKCEAQINCEFQVGTHFSLFKSCRRNTSPSYRLKFSISFTICI